jgi:hypothetical protein
MIKKMNSRPTEGVNGARSSIDEPLSTPVQDERGVPCCERPENGSTALVDLVSFATRGMNQC